CSAKMRASKRARRREKVPLNSTKRAAPWGHRCLQGVTKIEARARRKSSPARRKMSANPMLASARRLAIEVRPALAAASLRVPQLLWRFLKPGGVVEKIRNPFWDAARPARTL